MRPDQPHWTFRGIVVTAVTAWLALTSSSASAIEGTELNSSVGLWAPLLPHLHDDSGDSVGTIVGLAGHHRFDGYRTSVESDIKYGVTDSTEMLGVDALLRDTWHFGKHHLSAGFGYSMMNWEQEAGSHTIESDYQGAKIVTGWETVFGRRPVWVDLSLGLYDLDGSYVGGGNTGTIGGFAETYGVDVKSEFDCFGIPSRAIFGVNYLDDFASWKAGEMETDDAVVLTGAIEFFLF